MNIQGKQFHTIWIKDLSPDVVQVIDQRKLPFSFEVLDLRTHEDVYFAIKDMVVRGAPLIGVAGAYGVYLALVNYKGKSAWEYIQVVGAYLKSARPTAVNLEFAVDFVIKSLGQAQSHEVMLQKAFESAELLKRKEIENCSLIGDFGCSIIEKIYEKKKETVNILTHCNAGWLACIDWGTATAPMYKAHIRGIPVHIWVDETRPRNQGARLTAWELGQAGIPHTVIPDNTGGHLMQHGMVDMVIVGSDRTTANGDVANKIGTYLKALAASDNNVPFYVALPLSTFDLSLTDGVNQIPIEEREAAEVKNMEGWDGTSVTEVRIMPEASNVANYGFDVTPARLVTALITEKGICKANTEEIKNLFKK